MINSEGHDNKLVRSVSVEENYDVIVAGGGPSGNSGGAVDRDWTASMCSVRLFIGRDLVK
jgi:hypothetical protein